MLKTQSNKLLMIMAFLGLLSLNAIAQTLKDDGTYDPDCVVEKWSNSSTYPKVIDINFTDTSWPSTWQGETGKDCPEYSTSADKKFGGYVNAILETQANGSTDVKYPVLFHNCTFATKASFDGRAATTAAFARQNYLGEPAAGANKGFPNDWSVTGHKVMLEDNVTYGTDGFPTYGEAGFAQMCRTINTSGADRNAKKSWLGWIEIDHIPYIDRIQWSWSNTSAGRGIKCDYKIGDGEWKPLVWMCSDQIDKKYTGFSDQGYFIENVINASDVSLRWRVWDGENLTDKVQGNFPTIMVIPSYYQAPRLHKLQIFGSEITAEQAQFARDNKVNDPGELTDLSIFGSSTDVDETAPDANAPVKFFTVAKDGTGDYADVQSAIDAVGTGERGIIYIRKGEYYGQIFSGTKDVRNKYISLIGEDRDNTILTYDNHMIEGDASVTYDMTAPLLVYTDRFHAENLTLKNTSGNHGQALALYTRGDAHTFTNCTISGYQDTYKSNSGSRGYFKDCLIEGAVDFIYDSGTEWFEDCTINSIANGYVTAAGKADNTWTKTLYPNLSQTSVNIGLFLSNCNLTSNGLSAGSCYLGRPWGENCGTMFLNCKLGNHINAAGWTKMGDTTWQNCSYMEYNNTDASGNLLDTSSRVSWSAQATDAEVNEYFHPDYIFQKANKNVTFNYALILAGAAEPNNFTVEGNTYQWDAAKPAPGYIVYKDGSFYKILTTPEFTIEDNANYTIASVSSQGVVSSAVKIKETVKLLAFPTAEGFGKFASGGRGGKVVTVTTLADDNDGNTEGSLRWALKQYPNDPLTVTFNVSGWIILKSPLKIKRENLTIAGQTAPGEGITLYPRGLSINGCKNVIIRNIRSRCGSKDYAGYDIIAGADLVDQAFNAENAEKVIVDHCTFGWSAEEVLNNQTSHYQTYSYCLVHEGLYDAGHHKGSARGFGAQWGGSQTTMHHNMMAHNNSRSPRFQGARDTDFIVYDEWVNNVNFNWGNWGACYGGENNQTGRYSGHEINFCNNYYRQGPATKKSCGSNLKFIRATAGTSESDWHLSGNIMDGSTSVTNNNATGFTTDGSTDNVKFKNDFIVPTKFFINYEFDWATYTMKDKMESANDAYNNVLANVGTINRDAIETRIVNECKNGTATYNGDWGSSYAKSGIIDDPDNLTGEMAKDANGFIYCTVAKPSESRGADFDTDGDGIADEWERAHGLTVGVKDNNVLNEDGYTAIEVYLNSLMSETMDASFPTGVPTVSVDPAKAVNVYYNVAGQRVDNSYKGLVIKNGKKYILK